MAPVERIARLVRQIRMLDQRPLRLLAQGGAGLLFSALAGCGSVVASAPAAAPAVSSAGASSATAPATQTAQVGCASVNQATAVTIRRANHLVEPQPDRPLGVTDHQQAEVRALFGQMCAAVTHPAAGGGVYHCPADLGTGDTGAFYDGSRLLALFTYAPTGCQQVSVTAAGKTMTTLVVGRAADAAPHLAADVAAILGPEGVNPGGVNPGGVNPGGVNSSGVNPGGPDKSA
jgi:hypothetical protein